MRQVQQSAFLLIIMAAVFATNENTLPTNDDVIDEDQKTISEMDRSSELHLSASRSRLEIPHCCREKRR